MDQCGLLFVTVIIVVLSHIYYSDQPIIITVCGWFGFRLIRICKQGNEIIWSSFFFSITWSSCIYWKLSVRDFTFIPHNCLNLSHETLSYAQILHRIYDKIWNHTYRSHLWNNSHTTWMSRWVTKNFQTVGLLKVTNEVANDIRKIDK